MHLWGVMQSRGKRHFGNSPAEKKSHGMVRYSFAELEAIQIPEMVGDMSRVTLNFDLSKIPFVPF